jgi:nucleotide-binding universal stress UspA family protein
MVYIGDVIGSILQVEHKFQPDLLVMATHGRKGLARLFLGSIAEVVLRKADCPVLTIREEAHRGAGPSGWRRQTRDILCPVDFDGNSGCAVKEAAELARWSAGHVCLLHAVRINPLVSEGFMLGELQDSQIRDARAKLEETRTHRCWKRDRSRVR